MKAGKAGKAGGAGKAGDGGVGHRWPWGRFAVVALFVLADLWSKSAAFAWLESLAGEGALVRDPHGHARRVLIEPWFAFFTSCNPGSAFGMFREHPGYLVAGRILAVGVLGWLLWRAEARHRVVLAAMVLVLAGAVGNLSDNLWFGCYEEGDRFRQVRDFIDVWFVSERWSWDSHFPTFNVADSCITVGAFLWILSGFSRAHDEETEEPVSTSA